MISGASIRAANSHSRPNRFIYLTARDKKPTPIFGL